MQVNPAEELKKLVEEKYPIADHVATGKLYRRLDQVYDIFCKALADEKPRKVLIFIAQNLNQGKTMERAMADTVEQLKNGRKNGAGAEEQ